MYDVTAIGELLIDFTCLSSDDSGYPTMAAHPGGAPANYLAALSKYGARTAMIGKVGSDAFGKMLLKTLTDAGIETRGMVASEDYFTTLAFVTLDKDGDREFSFARKPGADMQLTVQDINKSLIDASRVLHFGTLSLTDEPSRSATYEAVEYAKGRGTLISFDPNLRRPLWRNMDSAREQMRWGLSHADVVKLSDDEADFLLGLPADEAAKAIIEQFGAELVFVTCGGDGCVYRNGSAAGAVGALRGIEATDTTGAGDIFGGAAMGRLLMLDKRPSMLENNELLEIVSFACTAAGLSTTRSGGISSVPEYREVLAAMSTINVR